MADPINSQSPPLSLSLRPLPKPRPDDDSIEKLVSSIHHKYGHFRHVTEEKVQKQIEYEEKRKVAEESEDEESLTADEDEKAQLVKLQQKRLEMFNNLKKAEEATGYLLETVSLLESKHLPRQAETTMSAILKTRAGIGTLAYDTWEMTRPDLKEEEMHRLAAKGWNHESLSSVADELLKAATRLNEDVKKETKYWDQVLSFTEKGWSVFKLPSGENALGVQIGATEAGLLFQNRGLVALRTNEDGSIKLHRHITAVQKTIRVRICKRGQITGSCRLPATDSEDELEDLVRRARDSLFDQELYHEMVLEARLLPSFNVTLRDSVLHLPLGPQSDTDDVQEVLVDLVSVDESTLPSVGVPTDDDLAELVAVVLRLLLSHAYHQRLRRRSQIPPPLTEQKRPNLPHAITRPLLSHLHHHNAANQLRTFLERVAKVLHAAGLTVRFDLTTHSTQAKLDEIISPTKTSAAGESIIHALINALSQPLKSTATFTLPSINATKNRKAEENTISIDINTMFAQPNSGVEYAFRLPTAMTKIILGPDRTAVAAHGAPFAFSTFSELTEYFCNLLATDIVHNIMAARHPRWKPIDRTPPAEIFASLGKPGTAPKPKEMVCFGIEVSDQNLELYLRQVDAREDEDEDALTFVRKQICVWNGSDGDRSFIEELKTWLEGGILARHKVVTKEQESTLQT